MSWLTKLKTWIIGRTEKTPSLDEDSSRLGGSSDPPGVAPLIKVLQDWNVYNGSLESLWGAARALAKFGTPSVQPLIEVTNDSPNVIEAVAWALGEIGDSRAVDLLIEQVSKGYSEAAEALGKIRDTRAVNPLIKALEAKSDTQRAATWALGKLGDGRAVEPLLRALQDEKEDVREQASGALGELGDKHASKSLIKLLNDRNYDVCEQAATALGKLGDLGAYDALYSLFKSSSGTLAEAAKDALCVLRPNERIDSESPRVDNTLLDALKGNSLTKLQAAVVMAGLRDPRSVDVLIGLLSDYETARSILVDFGISDTSIEILHYAKIDAPHFSPPTCAKEMGELKWCRRNIFAIDPQKYGKPLKGLRVMISSLVDKESSYKKSREFYVGTICSICSTLYCLPCRDVGCVCGRYGCNGKIRLLSDTDMEGFHIIDD